MKINKKKYNSRTFIQKLQKDNIFIL
jgi:hypothetical protein